MKITKQIGFTAITTLLLLIPFIILITIFLFSTYQNSRQNTSFSSKSQPTITPASSISSFTPSIQPTPKETATPEPPKRTAYNFSEIWSGGKKVFEDKEKGFRFYYPEIAQIYNYLPDPNSKSKEAYEFTDIFVVDIVSQLQEGTELYDGMRISLAFTSNQNSLSLNQLVEKVTPSQEDEYAPLHSSQSVSLNGYSAHEIIAGGWGGGDISYYLLNKKSDYFIRFRVIAVGPEKEEFRQL